MRRRCVEAAALACAIALWSCAGDSKDPSGCVTPGLTPALFVVNNLAETLTRFDLETQRVTCPTVTLGRSDAVSIPNGAVVHEGRLYVVESGVNAVEVFSLPGLSRLGSIDLGPGSNPWSFAAVGDHGFVTDYGTGDLARVDLTTLAVTSRVPAGIGPEGLAVAAGRVFVANTGYTDAGYAPGTVTVHDAASGAVLDTLFVGTDPQAMLVDSTGLVHVLCTGDYGSIEGRVFLVDPAAVAVIDSLDIGGTPGFMVLADSGRVYVSGWGVGIVEYDSAGRRMLRGIDDPVSTVTAFGLEYDPVEKRLYAASFYEDRVLVFDTTADTLEASFATDDGPEYCTVYRP